MTDERNPDWPQPTDDGPFLLIMRDDLVEGGLYMRRFATKEDAVAISANYLADRREWLFEVVGEVDLEAARKAFVDGLEI